METSGQPTWAAEMPPVPIVAGSSQAAMAPAKVTTVRVLHVINGEHFSGAERVQDLLARCLPAEGFEVGFACVKPGRFPTDRTTKTPLFELPMRWRFDLRPAWKMARLIREHGYRILHAHTPRSALAAHVASRLTGVPLVYHVHSPTAQDTTHRWRNWVNDRTERLSLSRATRMITVSQSLGDRMRKAGYADARICVVPNGVPRLDRVLVRQIPSGKWTLGAVALFRPRKGMEVLLDSLAELRRAGWDVRLRAVGPFETREYETELKQRVERLGLQAHVLWTGFTRDVNAELDQMDLFVLPSLFGEGLPMVVLEAMAAGVPVVGTQVEGVPEAIRDGVDGVIAAPGDPDSLARAIRRILTGELSWAELRRTAQTRHAERFSDRSMAAGVAAVYRTILADEQRASLAE